MRTSGLTLAAILMLTQGIAAGQSWDAVKSWSGTATIEATEIVKKDSFSSKLTYKATGDFKISDDMLPEGPYMQWPRPSVEVLTDPNRSQTAYKGWKSHVVAAYEASGVDEMGSPYTVKCTADHVQLEAFGVFALSGQSTYEVHVTAPRAQFQCPGREGSAPRGEIQQAPFKLTEPRKPPGPQTGSKTFTAGPGDATTVKVTYNMAPSR